MPKTTIEIWWNEPDEQRHLDEDNLLNAIRGKMPNTFVTVNGTPILEQPEQTDVKISEITVRIWWRAGKAMVDTKVIETALHNYFGGLPTFHVEEVHAPSAQQVDDIVEKLASLMHDIWGRWTHYLLNCCLAHMDGTYIIPSDRVRHWQHQIKTTYNNLTEEEKESDRKIAREVMEVHAPQVDEQEDQDHSQLDLGL